MKTFKHFVNGLVLVAVLAGNAIAVTSEQLRIMANRGRLVAGEKTLLIHGGFSAIANMFANNGNPKNGKADAAKVALNHAADVAAVQERDQADLEGFAARQAQIELERTMPLVVRPMSTPTVEEVQSDEESTDEEDEGVLDDQGNNNNNNVQDMQINIVSADEEARLAEEARQVAAAKTIQNVVRSSIAQKDLAQLRLAKRRQDKTDLRLAREIARKMNLKAANGKTVEKQVTVDGIRYLARAIPFCLLWVPVRQAYYIYTLTDYENELLGYTVGSFCYIGAAFVASKLAVGLSKLAVKHLPKFASAKRARDEDELESEVVTKHMRIVKNLEESLGYAPGQEISESEQSENGSDDSDSDSDDDSNNNKVIDNQNEK